MNINDIDYVCFHEVGHILATYEYGGYVECVQISDESNEERAFAKSIYLDIYKKHIACGGFAMERVLFEKGLLTDKDGNKLSTKSFIDASINSAQRDKLLFFGADFMGEDGYWPEELDREFMDFAWEKLAHKFEKHFAVAEEVVGRLSENRSLSRLEIEEMLSAHEWVFHAPLRVASD